MKRMMYSLAALVLCAPLAAQAVEGWVIDDVSLQAGPDPAYPSITELTAGTPVSIQGCISGWTWCDVVVGADRGWVPGTFLEEDYGGQRVIVVDYGPRIGIPVVSFSLGLYWDQHYHSRPFYAQRQQWVAKAIQPHQPQRPANAVARSSTPQPTTRQMTTANVQRKTTTQPQSTQQPPTMTARATAPRHAETTPPEAGKQPSQAEKHETTQPTTMAKAKPRVGEPKPKDELKKPKPKDDKHDQDGGGGEH